MAKAKNVNTVNSINAPDVTVSERDYQDSMNRSLAIFKDMPKTKVSVPKQFVNVLGESLPVTINGCTIVVPVDGKRYEIPEAFADVLNGSLQAIQTEDIKAEVVEERQLKGSL